MTLPPPYFKDERGNTGCPFLLLSPHFWLSITLVKVYFRLIYPQSLRLSLFIYIYTHIFFWQILICCFSAIVI
uniref:Uncharacterized protein n=1 Tax=Anguilla anguilla TaxID=7936 RepID=A0A0E9WX37_ANGAN